MPPGPIGVLQCGGLITNTLSPSATGNRQRPSVSVRDHVAAVRDHHAGDAGIARSPRARCGCGPRTRIPPCDRRALRQPGTRRQRQRRGTGCPDNVAPRRPRPTRCPVLHCPLAIRVPLKSLREATEGA